MTDIDPCLFISPTVICLTYVDDTLFFARDKDKIRKVVDLLRNQEKMLLEEEDDAAGFLGVSISRNHETKEVTFKQTGLMDRIIEALGVGDLPDVHTPADEVLGKDEDGDPANCTFNYASVIGMLWYQRNYN